MKKILFAVCLLVAIGWWATGDIYHPPTGSGSGGGGGGSGTMAMNANQFDTNDPASMKNGALLTNISSRGITEPNITASTPAYWNSAKVLTNASGTPDGTKFLRDDGVLAVPAGAGGPAGVPSNVQFNSNGVLQGSRLVNITNGLFGVGVVFPSAGIHLSNGANPGAVFFMEAAPSKFSIRVPETGAGLLPGIGTESTSGKSNFSVYVSGQRNFRFQTNGFVPSDGEMAAGYGANLGEPVNAWWTNAVLNLWVSNTMQLVKGAGNGKVLTSDANGYGSWQASGSGGGGGGPIGGTDGSNYIHTVTNLGSGTSGTYDWGGPDWAHLQTSGNYTLSFARTPTAGIGFGWQVHIDVFLGGAHTLTWPAGIDWRSATAPALVSGQTNGFTLRFDGTNLIGYAEQENTTGTGSTVNSNAPAITDPVITGTATIAGNPVIAASQMLFGTTGLIFEGVTADTVETLLTVADPTADRTITLPDATGTVVLKDSTDTLTGKTLDAAATGNVLKFKSYIFLTGFHNTTGATPPNTNDTTLSSFMKPVFSNSADQSANFVEWRIQVPDDCDTAVDMRAKVTFVLQAGDTATHRYVMSMVSPATSTAYAGTVANGVNLDFAGDASGASGDVEQVGYTTLTSWAANVTAGRHWVIRLARDGNDATDASTIDSMLSQLTIEYGVSQ